MKTPNFRRQRVAAAVAGVLLALGAAPAFATGFQLNEQSASSIGNAFAGGAAFTDDASGMWWNPAAIAYLPKAQVVGGVHLVTPSIKFHNDGGSLPAGCYAPACNPPVLQPLGHEGGDAGGENWIPNLYVSVPINPQWTFGLGVTVPFGLVTWYGDGWLGRYQALKSDVETINVNPVITWKPVPNFAIGVGANYQHIKATLTSNVNYSGLLLQAAATPPPGGAGIAPGSANFNAIAGLTAGYDSLATIHGSDDAWGWNIGAMWDVTPAVRIGASYRSEIKYHVNGNADFNNPTVVLPGTTPPVLAGTIAALSAGVNNSALYNGGVSLDLKVPDIANLSVHWQYDPRWEFMADVQYTGWGVFNKLQVVRSDGPRNGTDLQNIPENFDDTWKFAVGASYRYNDQLKVRMGLAYDQTPVNDTDRTPRLPDSDRTWLSLGAQYRFSPNFWADAAFTYIWGANASMNQSAGSIPSSGLIKGDYDASVTIFSAQMTYQF